jgi:hypothetical protein
MPADQSGAQCGVFTMNSNAKLKLLDRFDFGADPNKTIDFAQFVTAYSHPNSTLTLEAMFQDKHKQQVAANAKANKQNIKDLVIPTLPLDELSKLYNFTFLLATTAQPLDRAQLVQKSTKGSRPPSTKAQAQVQVQPQAAPTQQSPRPA